MFGRIATLVALVTILSGAGGEEKKPAEKKDLPQIRYPIPLIPTADEKQRIAFRGKHLDTVKEVKATGVEGVSVKLLGARKANVPNNYPAEKLGDSEIDVELVIPKGVKPGTIQLVAINPSGPSAAYSLALPDPIPRLAEKEPNDGFDQAQPLTLPGAVDGTIKGERDVDVYRFAGKKGDSVRISLISTTRGSPLDGILTLYSPAAEVLKVAETSGKTDPEIVFKLPADGVYSVVVMEANDLGGSQFGYQLVVRKE